MSLASKLPTHIEKMEVIHNGVPVSEGDKPNNFYRDKAYDVINVGSMHSKAKGQDIILRAMAKSSMDITAAFAGDGIMRKEYEALAAALNISDRVEFLGTVYPIRDYLRQAKMFVLVSSYEGLPIALLEAMSEGMPIVATNVGGVPELITNGITGLLIRPNNPTALANAILELLGDEDKAIEMGNRAKMRIEADFSIDQYTERIITAYLRRASSSA
jgi:Glycosyltransferase